MYTETYARFGKDTVFNLARLNDKDTLLVFFHGIGDSHINFKCFFHEELLQPYDLFVADLLGHGYSSSSKDYSFFNQCMALEMQLNTVIKRYKQVVFVPHSMGIVHAISLLSEKFGLFASGMVAIDTTVSEHKSFIAKKVEEVINSGGNFNLWFSEFCDYVFDELAHKDNELRRYFAGLMMVRADAFKFNALELRKLVTSYPSANVKHVIGEKFIYLPIPKLYCTTNVEHDDARYLRENNVTVLNFKTESHWAAQACIKPFCTALVKFINQL